MTVVNKYPCWNSLGLFFSSRDSGSRTPRLSSTFIYQRDGHIHQNPSPEGPYRNVSVEAIDYTPVNIEELRVK